MKWKSPVVYTAIGAILGASLMSAGPAFANSNFRVFWGNMLQNGKFITNAQAISYNGTSFFSIWYFNKLLAQDGIQANWDGKTLSLTNMPVQQSTTLSVNNGTGNNTPANSVVIDGVTYVPLPTVESILSKEGSNIQLQDGNDKQDTGNGQGREDGNSGVSRIVEQIHSALGKLQDFSHNNSKDDSHDSFEKLFSAIAQLQKAETWVTQLNSTSSSSTTTVYGSSNTGTVPTSTVQTALQSDITTLNQAALSLENGDPIDTNSVDTVIQDLQTQLSALNPSQGNWSSGNSGESDN